MWRLELTHQVTQTKLQFPEACWFSRPPPFFSTQMRSLYPEIVLQYLLQVEQKRVGGLAGYPGYHLGQTSGVLTERRKPYHGGARMLRWTGAVEE